MVVLDENGKPCRTCNTLLDFQSAMGGGGAKPTTQAPVQTPTIFGSDEEPPDSLELGRSTWTFLHSAAAYYPVRASETQQTEMRQLLTSLSHFYPCKPCARDFQQYLQDNAPAVEGREQLSLWMCDAHNAVNTKLGKQTFDCRYWMARWREGWDDFLASQAKK